MSILSPAIPAQEARTRDSKKIAYLYVLILVVAVFCQLFTYDGFVLLLGNFSLPGGELVSHLLGSVLVISEVLALPFLLRLKTSLLMRYISMAFSWIVPMIWIFLAFWVCLYPVMMSNFGFLGTVVSLVPGWWTVFVCSALGLLSVWTSWGLWPGKRE